MRLIRCKVCDTRMWDDDDGVLYCPNCGWQAGTPVDEDDSWPTE